ncbi:MAG: pilus assembly protein PilM [Candidatus Hydrogenedentota bacterium]
MFSFFKKEPPTIYGIDLSQHSIKLFSVKKDNSVIQDTEYFEEPVFETGKTNINDKKRKEVSNALETMINRNNIKVREVRVIIPSQSICLRRLNMVAMPSRDLIKALFFEIKRQHIPFADSETVIDYIILDEYDDRATKRFDICMAAAPGQLVRDIKDIVHTTDIRLERLEISPIIYLRLMKHISPILDDKTFLVVDMGRSKTEINIFDDWAPVIHRTIQIGGATITRNIMDETGTDFASAEILKQKIALGMFDQTNTSPDPSLKKTLDIIVVPVMQLIISDIKRSIQMVMPRLKHKEVAKIFLTGGTSLFPGIDIYFAKELNSQVELLGRLLSGFPNTEPFYHLLLGLMLVDDEKYFINLSGNQMQELRKIERRKTAIDRRTVVRDKSSDRRKRLFKPAGTVITRDAKKLFSFFEAPLKKYISIAITIVFLLLASLFGYYKYELLKYKKKYDSLAVDLAAINVNYNTSNELIKKNDDLKKVIDVMHNVELFYERIDMFFGAITDAFSKSRNSHIPQPKIALHAMTLTSQASGKGYVIKLAGRSSSTDAIKSFISELETKTSFSQVQLINVTQQTVFENNLYEFNISIITEGDYGVSK